MKTSKKSLDIRKFGKLQRRSTKDSSIIHTVNVIEPDLESRQSNLNNVWSYIKSLRKDNTGLAPLKDKGRLRNAAVDKANILNRQYQSVFTQG